MKSFKFDALTLCKYNKDILQASIAKRIKGKSFASIRKDLFLLLMRQGFLSMGISK